MLVKLLALRQQLCRCSAQQSPEMPRQMALIAEAHGRRHLSHGPWLALQQLLGAFDSAADDVLVRRDARGLLKQPREVIGTEGDLGGHALQRQVLPEVLVDIPEGTDQAAPETDRLFGSPKNIICLAVDVPGKQPR